MSGLADTVTLKNGKVYTGKIKASDSPDIIVIRSEGIDWTLSASQVASQVVNEEGTAEAAIQPPPPAPPPPPPDPNAGKGKKKGKKGKAPEGEQVFVTIYIEPNCPQCSAKISMMNLYNKHIQYKVKQINSGPEFADLCNRAKAFKVECKPLPIIEVEGKFYSGADMDHICVGIFEPLHRKT